MQLHRFHGGLPLTAHKQATAVPLLALELPALLAVSLQQHAGDPAEACVEIGKTVHRGQRIGVARGAGAHVHAPASGRVIDIREQPLPGRPTHFAPQILIAVDTSLPDAPRLPILEAATAAPEQLRERLREAGVVGLGGSAFPSHLKSVRHCSTLILNGVECEPWIACDDALLREQATDVLRGGLAIARMAGAGRVLLAIGDDMQDALAAVRAALAAMAENSIELVAVPARYPQGGERQLIETLTGLQVPAHGLPQDIGVLVHNVGTAAAAWHAVSAGEPLTTRIVTVTGSGVVRPCNLRAAIGTPFSFLVERAGGYLDQPARLLLGGSMTGIAIDNDQSSLGKMHNCLLALAENGMAARPPEQPCIRCGECASVCPARLQPQQLLMQLRANHVEQAVDIGLQACIECALCDLVCPSHIPLTQQFRTAKDAVARQQRQSTRADAARLRYEQRGRRLQRETEQRSEQEQARKAAMATPDAVAAALARARARRDSGKGD